MDKEKLDCVVALHAQWLRSGGKEGRQADLEDADLRQADLRGVDLSFATLTGANLERAELSGARLSNAILRRVNMSYANLRGADLTRADIQQAVGVGLEMTGAKLTGAIMIAARLDHSLMRSVDMSQAVAGRASLRRCDLSDARLAEAELADANLDHANMAGATFNDDAERLFAATLSFHARVDAEEPLDVVRMRSAQKRLLKFTAALQAVALWLTVAGIAGCMAAGVIDLGLVAWHRSFSAAMGFNYFVPLAISLLGVLMLAVAAFTRLKTIAEVRRDLNTN